MSYFLVVNYGIIGAAVTFLTAFIVNVLLQVYKTKKLLKTNLTELLPWKDFINLLLISTVPAIFLFVINNLPISIFLQLLYGAFVYFISVFFMILKSKYYSMLPINQIKSKFL